MKTDPKRILFWVFLIPERAFELCQNSHTWRLHTQDGLRLQRPWSTGQNHVTLSHRHEVERSSCRHTGPQHFPSLQLPAAITSMCSSKVRVKMAEGGLRKTTVPTWRECNTQHSPGKQGFIAQRHGSKMKRTLLSPDTKH